MADHLKD